ncbi:MAG: hypothetical protein QOF36_2050 [Microbacteriaceae bacterium]|jgi:hypothetical protein|nr:hypothetical protein [Microbacteriaceae bacterium]
MPDEAIPDTPAPDEPGQEEPSRSRPSGRMALPRSARRSLGSIVLGFELVIVFLGSLVIFGLGALPAPVALGGGAALVVAMGATIGLLRFRWAFIVGWILQAIVIAAGVLVPAFYIVGAIFTAMWVYCMIVGARLDRNYIDPHENLETENPE